MEFESLCYQVVAIPRQVGGFIRQESTNFRHQHIEYKGLNDLVSYVDKTAEEQLVAALKAILPEAGFITEEKTNQTVGEVYQWIIDPLDGTTNFIHGIPTYSVSIALQQENELVLGVGYEVCRDECFYAWKNGGAWLDGERIQVSQAPKLSHTLLATGLRRIGSAAVDLAYVACGRFDGYFEYNLNVWDVAAGAVLVKEAGGEVFSFSGGSDFLEVRELVATNGLISTEMLSIITKHFNT